VGGIDIDINPKSLEEATAIIAVLVPQNRELQEHNRKLEEHNRKLEERIQELEALLNKNSSNCSKPPSSDPPWIKRPPKKEPTGRKPGGQPGHEGHCRQMVPAELVKDFKNHYPTQCGRCGRKLDPSTDREVGEPLRHQVTEIPKVEPHVTEHRRHTLECTCGHCSTAALPSDVPRGGFAPRLLSTVAMMSGVYHLSKRAIEGLLLDMFGVQMGLGSITTCERAVSEAVAAPVEEARQYVRSSAAANADETGWKEKSKRAWLWVAATPLVAVFMVHARRSKEAALQLLGGFAGILTTDRFKTYGLWPLEKRQACWAHLTRDFNFISEHRGLVGDIGLELVKLGRKIFKLWYRVRDGTMSREQFKRRVEPIKSRMKQLLADGTWCRLGKAPGMCLEILRVWPAMWTFVEVEGVEPTNNHAERILRRAVLWRKRSFGTQSEGGSRFVERLLTVSATLTLQGRNVLDYLTQATEASLSGNPVPSLLPVAENAPHLAVAARGGLKGSMVARI
jgi:transposase